MARLMLNCFPEFVFLAAGRRQPARTFDAGRRRWEDAMTPNVGGGDRLFRIVLGVVVIALGVYFKSWWGALGALPLLTGLFRFCPVYLPFGTSTCESKPLAHT